MKIVIFYQYFGTPKGSWSTRVYELCRRWVNDGHEVTVVTSPYEKSDIKTNAFIEKLNVDGIKLIVIKSADSNRDSTIKRAFNAVLFAIFSVYYALTLPMDIIVSSSGPITIGIPGLFAKWFRRKKFVFEVRDLWPQGAIELGKLKSKIVINIAKKFEKLCYKNAAFVVACSEGMKEGILRSYPKADTIVIPNASDPDLFSVSSADLVVPDAIKGKSIFLYAGSLGLMDDCEQIINAMAMIKDTSIAMVFIGDGAERKHLESKARSCGNNNIFFLGLIPKTDVVKWFSIAQASFVTFKDLPVLHTSSPNKMFDSFAAGVPIIQSTKGWIKELVIKERCGINVRPEAPEDFVKAIFELSNNDIRRKMALNAKRLGLIDFNRSDLASKYLEKMKTVVHE